MIDLDFFQPNVVWAGQSIGEIDPTEGGGSPQSVMENLQEESTVSANTNTSSQAGGEDEEEPASSFPIRRR